MKRLLGMVLWGAGMGLLLPGSFVTAQTPLIVERVTEPIAVDGKLDESVWSRLSSLPMSVYEPTPGALPSERTEVRLAHDGVYLYIAGRLWDSDPQGIRVQSLTRDRLNGDDQFVLVLDSFNDKENAVMFTVTPAGTRHDAAISGNAEGGGWLNSDWNALWDAETTRTEDGWSVEMRIPFSSVRFQSTGDQVRMGIAISRLIARKAERHIYPALSPSHAAAYLKPSLLHDVQLEGVQTRTPLDITPYVLSRMSHRPPSQAADGGAEPNSLQTDVGLDLKYGLTSNLTLDLTWNTDFAQVEADDQQVNLSRFSLFFPEKRPFFQERAGIFYFPLGGPSRLFYSRRIGLSDTGQPVPILGGARVAGRIGAWDVGALSVQSEALGDLPSQNAGVLRLRRSVLNRRSWIGTLITTEADAAGGFSFASGVDGSIHLGGDDYLTFNAAATGDALSDLSKDAAFLSVWTLRRRAQGASHYAGYTYSGRHFDPAVGLEVMDNYTFVGGGFGYGWIPSERHRMRSHRIDSSVSAFWDNADGRLQMASSALAWSVEGRRGGRGKIRAELEHEDLVSEFPLPENTRVDPGQYRNAQLTAEVGTPEGQARTASLQLLGGTFYDGWRVAPSATSSWFISPHLEVRAQYQLNVVDFPEREQGFTAHVGRLRLRTALNRQWSTDALLQYSSVADRTDANVRLRYNVREGSDLWVVYNEALETEDILGSRSRLNSAGRALVIKYSHTFR